MRKWGLHYLCLLILAVVLAGCGSADRNSAADSSAKENGSMSNNAAAEVQTQSSMASSADQSTAAAPETETGGGENLAVKGSTPDNTVQASAGFTGSDVVAGLNKKLIYKANLNMEVEDYGKAQTEIRNLVTMANGYIIEFNENMSQYEQGGTFILKVPASGFSPFLNKLEQVKHESLQRSIQGQDVSEEYVDLESRLKAKQLMEAQYTEFMKKATKSTDLVAFANELGSIQETIEQIKGRMRYINQNVSFSTVELRVYQTDESIAVKEKEEQGPLLERASDALKGSLNALSVMFQWIVVILAGALPILIGVAIILAVVLVSRKNIRERREQQTERMRQRNKELNREQIIPAAKEIKEAASEDDLKANKDSEKE
ncbi:DUF4349 domain-containing protein [Paenibacillus sp. RS8]|uniref:DUF4349 domain-containing protein n=1 Tax=Paenibacillus odorifer TaxID=189426 RepID=A0A1R0XQX6_9BACL|nr:DUF4349 domain-containing protein [Paenibacillus odorifer]OMD37409.1 hypothetical protein BSK52_21925 [Paenibacillus odorifer]